MFIPDPRSEFSIPDPDPRQGIKVFLTQTIFSTLSEIWSGMIIPDPDLYFLPILDPEVKKASRKSENILDPSPDPEHCFKWYRIL